MSVQARDLRVSLGDRQVLRGVSMHVDAGEIVALLGPNGAGKTTLMCTLVGLLSHSSGTVQSSDSTRPGWVPQGAGTWSGLTVRENLELMARLLPVAGGRGGARRAAAQVASECGLADRMDDAAWQLSGGLRQRLNVAAGLLGDPPVVILDEPMTGVDLAHRRALMSILRERAASGSAVLLSTHSLEEAAEADRVVVLVDGAVAFDGALAGVAHDNGSIADGLLELWAPIAAPATAGGDR